MYISNALIKSKLIREEMREKETVRDIKIILGKDRDKVRKRRERENEQEREEKE